MSFFPRVHGICSDLYAISTTPVDDTMVVIGTQIWKQLNVDDNIDGSRVYDDDEDNRAIYGGLYSFSMFADIEALYPGFHVPTRTEFLTLVTYSNSLYGNATGALKATGTDYWFAPNTGATNALGFTSLPGGEYVDGIGYAFLGNNSFMWTATDALTGQAYALSMSRSSSIAGFQSFAKASFVSVRLIKDAAPSYGSELITSWDGNYGAENYDTFTSSGKDIVSAINTSAHDGSAKSNEFDLDGLSLYYIVVTITLNSGTLPSGVEIYTDDGYDTLGSLVEGINIFNYQIADAFSGSSLIISNDMSETNYSATFSVKKVL